MGTIRLLIPCCFTSIIHATINPDNESKVNQVTQTQVNGSTTNVSSANRIQNLQFEWNDRLFPLSMDEDPVSQVKTFVVQLIGTEPYVLVFDESEIMWIMQMRKPQNISTSGNRAFYIHAKLIQFGEIYAIVRFSLTKDLNIKAHYWPFMEMVYVYQHLQNRLKRSPPDSQSDFAATLVFLTKEVQNDPSLTNALNAVCLLVATCTNPVFLARIINCVPRVDRKRVLEALLRVCDTGSRSALDPEGWTALQTNKSTFENMLFNRP